jgi:hypothetical protein
MVWLLQGWQPHLLHAGGMSTRRSEPLPINDTSPLQVCSASGIAGMAATTEQQQQQQEQWNRHSMEHDLLGIIKQQSLHACMRMSCAAHAAVIHQMHVLYADEKGKVLSALASLAKAAIKCSNLTDK